MPRVVQLLALVLPALAGCGGGDTVTPANLGGAEERMVANLLSEFNEVKGNPAKLKPLFADPPARPTEYQKREYTLVLGSVKVKGDTAAATVQVCKEDDGTLIEAKEWTFAKSGDKWKIRTAPLPAGK